MVGSLQPKTFSTGYTAAIDTDGSIPSQRDMRTAPAQHKTHLTPPTRSQRPCRGFHILPRLGFCFFSWCTPFHRVLLIPCFPRTFILSKPSIIIEGSLTIRTYFKRSIRRTFVERSLEFPLPYQTPPSSPHFRPPSSLVSSVTRSSTSNG